MTHPAINELLRSLPSVDEVLASPVLTHACAASPHAAVVDAVRQAISEARQSILEGATPDVSADAVAKAAHARLATFLAPSLRRVINASGVIVHTNLGRSVLAPSAVEAVVEAASGYSTLEYDAEHMCRGSRHDHCERLICLLTGAEAAIAVNNNAAAVMMVLSTFAAGHKAVVSRGELVEIGGSFRIPDIMALSQADMVEVGTTNKTHAEDYVRAIDDDVAMLLKVHTSNYRLVGFTESVCGKDLRRIADKAIDDRHARNAAAPDLLVYEDLGSGAFMEVERGVEHPEPTVAEALAAGCDLVSFSGDKLLGGPQAGIIVGSAAHINRLKKSPLARALRLDKMTIAALEATLRLYLDPERARVEVPTLRMLDTPADALRPRAERLAGLINDAVGAHCAIASVVPEISRAGGGALPMCDIPTFAVQVTFKRGTAQGCDEHLVKGGSVPIVARIKKETLLLDVRTVLDEREEKCIAQAIAAYFGIVEEEGIR